MFTKKNLKTGMVIELEKGDKYMVLIGNMQTCIYGKQEMVLINKNGFEVGTNYNDSLCYIDIDENIRKDFSIKSVYKPEISNFLSTIDESNETNLIWKRKPEVDWRKVPIDTKVLVKDNEKAKWGKRYFSGLDEEKNKTAYENGCTSFTADTTIVWEYMVLYEGNEHLLVEENNNDRI